MRLVEPMTIALRARLGHQIRTWISVQGGRASGMGSRFAKLSKIILDPATNRCWSSAKIRADASLVCYDAVTAFMGRFCQNVRVPLQEFICMGRGVDKAAGRAATAPSSHTMSNLPGRRFTSISIEQAGDMCSHMRADYTRDAGFASITSASSNVSAPVR